MSAEANNIPIDDDLNTTAPQEKRNDWKMPEPIFKRTSGRLPKGYEKQYSASIEESEGSPLPEVTAHAAVEPEPKNPTVKLILVLLGIMAMIAFIAVFLTVVYFLFLRSSD